MIRTTFSTSTIMTQTAFLMLTAAGANAQWCDSVGNWLETTGDQIYASDVVQVIIKHVASAESNIVTDSNGVKNSAAKGNVLKTLDNTLDLAYEVSETFSIFE